MRLLFFALLATTVWLSPAGGRADDCSIRASSRDDPKWKCRRASSFKGGCIPSKAFTSWKCLELDADATLCDDGGAYNMTVYLAHSDATLDCAGQVIDHGYPANSRRNPGLRTPYSKSVQNVTVENCRIRNVGRYGADLKRFFRGDELRGPMRGHHRIQLRNISIEGAQQWGVYVGQNSRGMVLKDVSIDRAYGGIYLEAGSAFTRISAATITNSHTREALAIDSSAHNLVENSRFAGNVDAIRIYKNCGENWGQVCPIPRAMASDDNVLRGNRFEGEDVRVAYRQYKLYGIGFCHAVGLVGYWRDRVARTVVDGNVFVDAALKVDDGPVLIHGNRFMAGSDVVLGSLRPPFYFAPAAPIAGIVANNTFGRDSTVAYDTRGVYEDLFVFGNRRSDGVCAEFNRCRDNEDNDSTLATLAITGHEALLRGLSGSGQEPSAAADGSRARTLILHKSDRAEVPRARHRRGLPLYRSYDLIGPCTGCR